MALPHDYYNNPPAYMGFVGYLRIKNDSILGSESYSHNDMIVRATSANLQASQEINKPDVVDSRYDRTVYRLGPKTVGGSLEFPAVYDIQNEGDNVVEAMYRYAATRDPQGLLNSFDVDIKYATSNSAPNQADFTYEGCVVNTWEFSVSNQEVVNISTDIIGINRIPNNSVIIDKETLSNTRLVTWNDARVELSGGRLSNTIGGQYVRSFNVEVNNNVDRFYTLNKQLIAQAVAPTQRDVTGSLTVLGRHQDLGEIAYTNEDYCSGDAEIKFGFETKAVGDNCQATFATTVPNVIFEIESMELSNDIFETSINWHAFPAAGTGIDDPLIKGIGNTSFTY